MADGSTSGKGTSVGGIYYTCTVDTKGLIDAERQAEKSTGKMATSLTAVAEASKLHAAAAGVAAAAVREATRVTEAAAAANSKAAGTAQAAAKATDQQAMSAKQLSAAMRGVPAQMTDIVTSLGSGQNPFTVLLQQGGQLKDMFGGIGPAARALGGYVAGLVSPFTLAATAAAVFLYGLVKGRSEIDDINRSVTLSGQAYGGTADKVNGLAAELDNLAGVTRGQAAEALTTLIDAGVRGGAALGKLTQAAIQLEQAGGPAVEKTAKAFADLQKDPLTAALRLNDSTNFLTESLYKQIKALVDQGRQVEAATIAQKAYADAMLNRAPQILENLGWMEKGWKAVSGWVREAVDGVKGFGRELSLVEQLGKEQAKLDTMGKAKPWAIKEQQDKIALIQEQIKLGGRAAEQQAAQQRRVGALAQFDKDGAQFLDKKLKMERDIAAARELGKKAGLDDLDIEKRVAAIRASYADKKQTFDQSKYLSGLAADAADEFERLAIIEQEALRQHDELLKKGDLSTANHQLGRNLIIEAAAEHRQELQMRKGEEYRAQIEKEGREEVAAETRKQAELKRARDGAMGDIVASDPIASLELELQRKLAINALYAEQDLANETLYAQQRVALKQQTAEKIREVAERERDTALDIQAQRDTMAFAMAQSAAGQMLGILQRAGKERTALGKALFLAERALAVATIIVNTEKGASVAAGFGPFGIPMATLIRATGYASAGMVAGMAVADAFGGGRQYGGPVDAGSLYRVGEGNRPEMFVGDSGRSYMIPGERGKVVSNGDLAGGGNGREIKIVIENTGTPQRVVSQSFDAAKQAHKLVMADLEEQFSTNTGRAYNSLTRSTNVRGRL